MVRTWIDELDRVPDPPAPRQDDEGGCELEGWEYELVLDEQHRHEPWKRDDVDTTAVDA